MKNLKYFTGSNFGAMLEYHIFININPDAKVITIFRYYKTMSLYTVLGRLIVY